MSYENNKVTITLPVASDQSTNMYRFVKGSGIGVVVNDVAGGPCIGVLDTNDANAAGKRAPIVVGGVAKVAAGAACAAWSNVQSDATGRAIPAAAADFSQGIALAAATAAGQVIPVLLRPQAQTNP